MSNDWRDQLRIGLESLLDQAVVSGVKQADVFNAAIEEIERLRIANERDPHPADYASQGAIEEPANDLPAASNRVCCGAELPSSRLDVGHGQLGEDACRLRCAAKARSEGSSGNPVLGYI